jgi:CRP/FNR family transcriptional regulator, anaerobic regulatory protein
MLKQFYEVFGAFAQLNVEDKNSCEAVFLPHDFAKNTILEEENKTPKHLYFINKGFMRLFYYDDHGDEVTTLIAPPNRFITPFLDFINEKKSNLNLVCITDCEVLKVERSQLVSLIEKSENFKKISIIIFEQAIATTQIRANDLATLTAELRYKKLMDESPEIAQNVPIQYIASYLGIKPQSLSRIRKQLIK